MLWIKVSDRPGNEKGWEDVGEVYIHFGRYESELSCLRKTGEGERQTRQTLVI
jgi:hypothetical protein